LIRKKLSIIALISFIAIINLTISVKIQEEANRIQATKAKLKTKKNPSLLSSFAKEDSADSQHATTGPTRKSRESESLSDGKLSPEGQKAGLLARSFIGPSGYSSYEFLLQHINKLKEQKFELSVLQTKFVNTKKDSALSDDDDEPLWEPEDLKPTGTEEYMYVLIKNVTGLAVPDVPRDYDKIVEKTRPWSEVWSDMFSSTQRPFCDDDTQENPNLRARVIKPIFATEEERGVFGRLPSNKPNTIYNFFGLENSAYLFDYLDYLLQKKMAKAFQKWWEEVRTLPPKAGVDDPYNPYNQALLMYYNIGSKPGVKMFPPKKTDSEKDLIELISKLKKDFPLDEFKTAITIPQIGTVYEKYKWNYNANDANYFKRIMDKYDFDGDGRLSAREFILLTIWENRKDITKGAIKFPFYKLVRKYIQPIFHWCDCTNSGYIGALQIWTGFKDLKREGQIAITYNMYDCKFPGGDHRTSAANDFVLKNTEEFDGYVSMDEFAKGILLGFWDRQVVNDKIFEGDEKNMKNIRWEDDKVTDKECKRIKAFSNN